MPPKPAVSEVIRCAVKTNRLGKDQINVFYVKGTFPGDFGAFTQANLDAVSAGVFTAFHDQLLVQLTTDTNLVECLAVDLSSVTGLTSLHTGSGAGGLGGTAMPSNVALCVSWKEALHYRGGHPRSYMGGVSATFLADVRHVTTSFAGIMQTAANNFRTAVNAIASPGVTSFALVGVHYTLGKVPRVPPLVTPVLTASVNTRLDSQRRRLGK